MKSRKLRKTRKPITESLRRARGLKIDRKTRRLYEAVNSTIENQDRYNELVDNLLDKYTTIDKVEALLTVAQDSGFDPLGKDFNAFIYKDFDFFPNVTTDEELGERYAEDVIDGDELYDLVEEEFGEEIASRIEIDYKGLGRDIRLRDGGRFTKYGYFAMHK